MSKEKKEVSYSRHHLLPVSQGGANSGLNLVELRDTTHRSLHCLFANQMFAQQLLTMTNLNAKALRPEIVNQLLEILDSRDMQDPYQRYKPKVIK